MTRHVWPAFIAAAVLIACALPAAARTGSGSEPSPFDEKAALRYSQAAIGRAVGSYRFLDRTRQPVDLTDFRGKPLIINMVYTSCYHTCPMILETLHESVNAARSALGPDAFAVATIGFDTEADTPARMRAYAQDRGVALSNWRFLSGDEETVRSLARTLGFIYYPSPKGFDHLAQTTIIDEQGKVYAHLYGAGFSPPSLVEPLKDLVFGRGSSLASFSGLADRIRLFCTIYDPRNERYYFDYSIFIGIVVGALTLGGIATVLARNLWRLWRESRTG